MIESARGGASGHESSTRERVRLEEDRRLLLRFRDGDESAFLLLFDRHAEAIGLYCYRMIGDRDRARDVAQDVWVKLIALADENYEVRNPLGLLYRIARNLSLNEMRDRREHQPLERLAPSEHPVVEQRIPGRLEEMAIIALDRLPLEQREVFILHAYSGYTFVEIAEMLDESPGTIRMRAMRGRTAIKRIIAALIEFEENGTRDAG